MKILTITFLSSILITCLGLQISFCQKNFLDSTKSINNSKTLFEKQINNDSVHISNIDTLTQKLRIDTASSVKTNKQFTNSNTLKDTTSDLSDNLNIQLSSKKDSVKNDSKKHFLLDNEDSAIVIPANISSVNHALDTNLISNISHSDTLNCFVNGKYEKITCTQYKYVLNEHWRKKILLDSANNRIKELENALLKVNNQLRNPFKRTTSKLVSYDINSIDNLPIDVYYNEKSYSVYIVNPKRNGIQLFNKNKNGEIHNFSSIKYELDKEHHLLLFAMNAGMYDSSRLPVGLYIENGKEKHSINLKTKSPKPSNFYNLRPNGVFAISFKNKAFIVESQRYNSINKHNSIKLATQSGPLMVINGKINSHFRKGSSNLNIRNGVGINNSGNIVFVISNDFVNFYEFSEFFRDILECNNALYLDGVVSKMFLPELDKIDLKNSTHLGPIITVVK